MRKRFWVCGIVVAFVALFLDFLVHGVLLRGDYNRLVAAGIMRAPEDAAAYMPYMLAAHLLIGYGLTWLYIHFTSTPRVLLAEQGARSPALDGLRFGAAVAVMATIPGYLVYYAVQPLPAVLVHKQMIFSTLAMLLLGWLLSWLNPGRRTL